jgi:hypothetical protein
MFTIINLHGNFRAFLLVLMVLYFCGHITFVLHSSLIAEKIEFDASNLLCKDFIKIMSAKLVT